jgi:hypothetical protein
MDIQLLNHLIIVPEGKYSSSRDEGVIKHDKTYYEISDPNSPDFINLSKYNEQ